MKRLVSLLVAVLFGFNSVFGWSAPVGMSMANVLAGGGLNSALLLPVAKGFEMVNGSMVFTWDKDEVAVGKDEFLKAFFIALQLKDKHFWVDMGMLKSVYEVLDPALVGTIIGRVFIESDIELKKRAMEMLRDVEIEGEDLGMFRLWIVPDKAEVLEKKDGMGVEIKNLRLKVRAEIVRGMGDEIRRYIEGEMVKKLTKEVNEGREFEALRKVFGAIVLAKWYKENAREGWPYYEIAGRDVMNDSLREDNWSVREYLEEYGRIVIGTIEANDVPFVGGGIIMGQGITPEVIGKVKDIEGEKYKVEKKENSPNKTTEPERHNKWKVKEKIFSGLLILLPTIIFVLLPLPLIWLWYTLCSIIFYISFFVAVVIVLGIGLMFFATSSAVKKRKSGFEMFSGEIENTPISDFVLLPKNLRKTLIWGSVLSGLFGVISGLPTVVERVEGILASFLGTCCLFLFGFIPGIIILLESIAIFTLYNLVNVSLLEIALHKTKTTIEEVLETKQLEKQSFELHNRLKQIVEAVRASQEANEGNLAQMIGAVAYQIVYKNPDLWQTIRGNLSLGKIIAIKKTANWYKKNYVKSKRSGINNKRAFGLLEEKNSKVLKEKLYKANTIRKKIISWGISERIITSEEVKAIERKVVKVHLRKGDILGAFAARIYNLYHYPQLGEVISKEILKSDKELKTLAEILDLKEKIENRERLREEVKEEIDELFKMVAWYYEEKYVQKGKGIVDKDKTGPKNGKTGGIDLRSIILVPYKMSREIPI